MCLAVPGKIIRIDGSDGQIDFGGVVRRANMSLVEAKVGDWAVVHAGFAIEIMDEAEAEETIRLWNEVLDSDKAGREGSLR
ncbi:MAG: HypC/HybG/HupF family hydrogenase formation chaperone [Candidatus Methanoplasma sp.]|jgi:hydrogenase expression/formation protein HypC|nr:HypC/HybG/HupF family hydrogenase formation chaperone [Candidatus Methanoplasma sp.]